MPDDVLASSLLPDAPATVPRICHVRPSGDAVVVRLTADNGLRSVARMWLYRPGEEPGDTPREQWDMTTGDDGSSVHVLATPPAELRDHALAWTILSCALLPATDAGRIRVRVFQEYNACPLEPPADYDRTGVPQCAGAITLDRIDDGLMFRLLS